MIVRLGKMQARDWRDLWIVALLCTVSIPSEGQGLNARLFIEPSVITYGGEVLLSCFALSGTSPYTFTWVAPPGSSSLSRATNDTQPTSSELTFFAFEEDDGEYQCIIADSSTTESDTDDLTVVPAIVIGPMDMTLEYSDTLTATFTCTAFGGDGAVLDFTWSSPGSPSGLNFPSEAENVNADNSTTSSITTNTLGLSDRGGSFSCDVMYSGGQTNEASGALNIVPAILEDPRSILVGVGLGRNSSFTCTAYGGPLDSITPPSLTFTWSGPMGIDISNVETLEPVINNTFTSVLTLVNVTEDYEGNYNCSVAYSDMPDMVATSEQASLGAIRDPPDITEPPQNTTVSRGNNATFTCSAVGNGTLNITWRLPTGEIDDDAEQEMPEVWSVSSTLTIPDVTAADGGSYACLVENEAGVSEATAVLSVPLYISGEQVGLNTSNGSMENITCMIEGFPITYVWEKMDEVNVSDSGSVSGSGSGSMIMPEETYSLVMIGRVLEFNPILFGAEGVYRCVAIGDVGDEVTSDAITVTISPEDGVTVTPVDEVYEEGDTVAFTCIALGGPDNSLQWQKDGEDFGGAIDASENTLTLINITVLNDSGVYTCVASNAAGTGSASVSLNISPVFDLHPTSITTSNGTDQTFMCNAMAFPEPTYVWVRVSGDLPEMALGANTSMLTLSPAVFEDQGEYFCDATSNGVTVSSNTATLTISPEGGVRIIPENATFNDSDPVTLMCITLGGPGNTFQWSFNGEDVENETSSDLTLTNVSAEDGGMYTCNVTNSAGSDTFSTYVFISPMITSNPISMNASNGTALISFSCDAAGFPEPQIEWRREGGSLPTLATGENTTTLTIAPVLFGDEGLYYCVATSNALSVESERATLSISPMGSISPDITIADIGGTFMFMCNVMGGPNNVFEWQLNSVTLTNETMDTLLLTNVAISEAGTYTCIITNDAGEETLEAELFIRPNIITSPQDMEVNVNETVSFTCEAEGAPVPDIQWEYVGDGESTPSTNTSSGSGSVSNTSASSGSGSFSLGTINVTMNENFVTSILTLDPVMYDDYGLYRCVATSTALMVDLIAESDIATLTVSPEGSVSATPSQIRAVRNTTETFMCSAEGGPGNTFNWTRLSDGGIVSESSELEINVVNASVGGSYQCTVENMAGSESAIVSLYVVQIITLPPVDANVTRTEELQLTCAAEGFPLPSITWTHNGTDIDAAVSSDITITEVTSMGIKLTSTLTVTNTSFSDSGDYTCRVESSEFPAVTSDTVLVLIQDRPEQPQNVTTLNITSRSLTLEWIEPHHNNAPISGYRVMYNHPAFINNAAQVVVNSTETRVDIVNLHPGVTYTFTVVAFNDIGDSVPSEGETATTLEEVPASPPQNVTTMVESSTAIRVSWEEVPAFDRNGEITEYEVQYEPLETFGGQISISTVTTSMLSINLTDLQEFVDYNISVRAYTSAGPGPYSIGVVERTDTDEPAEPPQNVTTMVESSTALRVSWEEVPAIDRNGEITEYEVQYEPLETFGGQISISTVTTSMLSINLTDLQEFVDYNISVRAYTSAGPGPYSIGVVERTDTDEPAEPPQNVTTMVESSTALRVSWEEVPAIDRNGEITEYEVQYEPLETFGGQIATSTVNTSMLSINLTGLQEFVDYNISVRAYTSAGPGPYSDPVTEMTDTDLPASPPQNVTAMVESSTAIRVSWEEVPAFDRNGVITEYEVQYEPLETFGGQISTSTVNTSMLSINLIGLQEFVDYNISVRAYTSAGPGPYSIGVVERTDTDEPAEPPQNVMTMVESSTALRVTWEEVPAIDRNGEITEYEVQYKPLETFGGQISTSTVNTSMLSIILTDLQEFVDYNISVRAYTSAGPGPYSDPVTERTDTDLPASPPQNVTAMVESSTAIRVTWEEVPAIDRNGEITEYEVQYEPLETFGGQISTSTVNTSMLSIILTGLQEFVDYNISVRAYTSAGPGPYSIGVVERTDTDEPAEPPQNVTTVVESSTALRVSWEEVPAIDRNGVITEYEVQYEPLETFGSQIATSTVNTSMLSINLTGLQEFVDYNISVRAYTSAGPGPYSIGVVERTDTDEPAEPPQNVTTMVESSTALRVSWEEVPAIDRNGEITEYEVQYEPLETFGGQISTSTVNTSMLSITLTGLQEFVDYNISVRAYTSAGPGPYSDPVTEMTDTDLPASPPQNVTAMVESSTTIRVTWEEVPAIDRNGVITMYEVQYEPLETFGGQISTSTVNTSMLSILLTDLQEFVDYNISVRAYTSAGPGPYSIGVVERTDTDEPAEPPQNVTTMVESSTAIRVTWEEIPAIDRNGEITEYEVQYEPLETFGGQISTSTVNTSMLSILLTDLQEFVDYNISVRAYTSAGPGPYSIGVVERTDTDEPAEPPQNVTTMVESSTALRVSWEGVPAIDRNGEITEYEVQYEPLETFGGQISTSTVNTSMLSINLTGLQEFVDYNISVRAYTSAGPGPYSEEILNTTAMDVPSGFPMNITATTLSSSEIIVNWTTFPDIDHNGIITQYEVQFNQSVAVTSFPPSDSILVSQDTTSAVLTGLGPLINYTVTVRAHTAVGPGPYSLSDAAITETDPAVPGTPPKPPPVNDTEIISLPPEEALFTVTLRFEQPEVPGGVLLRLYIILVALAEDVNFSGMRKRRQTDEFLDNCIMGGVNNNFSVSANTTELNVNATAFTRYEFQVQGENNLGVGELSNATQFTTLEAVPTMPEGLLVQYDSSMSLDVTWSPPLCDYGIRTNYTFTYFEVGNETNSDMTVIEADSTNMTLSGLIPNTLYNVSICAATSVGCGPFSRVINSTDEDIPQEVTNLVINMAERISDTLVKFTINWEKPSDRNGSFNYQLVFEAMQLDPYPEARQTNVSMTTRMLNNDDGNQEEDLIAEALPFANYTITLTAVNIKLNRSGPSTTVEGRTIAIAPTAITELKVKAVNSGELEVTWDLPQNPNGPLSHYMLFYREQGSDSSPQTLPISTTGYVDEMVASSKISYMITGLDAFTHYSVIVQAVGIGLQGLLTTESEFVIRTHASTDTPPTINPTDVTIVDPSRNAFLFPLPNPNDIDTGPVIFYAIIIIRITDSFDRENPPNQEAYINATSYDPTAVPPQEYYITAAWSDPDSVPMSFLVGDGSKTVANGVTYENVALKSDTDYVHLIRIDIQSDTNEPLIFYTDFEFFKTDEVPPGPNAVAIGVSVTVIILILVVVAVVLIVILIYWRRRAYKELFEGEIAEPVGQYQQPPLALQTIHTNPSVSPYSGTMEPIPLAMFKDHVQRMHSNDDYFFSEEYSSIEPNHAPSSIASHLSCNTIKNRYANIVSYDQSRVKLEEDPNKEGSDYINANHIDGYKQKNGFIAAQGPNPDTVTDFWRMAWEQGTATIVMVTNLEEKGRVKCHQYWPEEKSGLYGRIRVHLQETLVLADYTQRSFSLQMNNSKEERIVTQYHYTVWPDHGVPEYPTSLLHFVRKVMAYNPENSGPIIVHCSAGVGRTGTFITLFSQLLRMEKEKNLDIFGFVRAMRYRRNCMVQTEPQYVFIHDALLEAIECGITEVQARDVQEQYRQLCEVDVETKVTGLFTEFSNLGYTIHRKLRRNTGTMHVNKPKNRFGANPDAIPYDQNRCRLSTIPGVEGSDYINASFVDGYHKSRAFIATQGPLPDTKEDFWRLIWEQKSTTIVMLTKEKEAGKVKCHRYWPMTGAEQFGELQVILHQTTDYTDYTLREFKVVDSRDGSSLNVKQFQYTDWPEESVPASGSGLIDLIGQVQKWQTRSGDRPIVVHCSGGCGRTGTYVAVSILIERLKTEGVVDVFHTVRSLRLQRPGMVNTESQYEFCYKTTLEYLESFELYDNFK